MSQDTADVVVPTGKSFTLSITCGTIHSASLETTQSSTPLTVDSDGMSVKVDSPPSGDSFISMAMIWNPGDTDAVVSVTAPAEAVVPPPIIRVDDNPGTVAVFGRN